MHRLPWLAMALGLSGTALAVPTTLTHQGRLFDVDGRPIEGLHRFSFGLYDRPESGAPVWSEDQDVALVSGLYTIDLGAVSPLDDRVFDGRTLYLQIAIDGGIPMTPRHAVSSVPYAQRAAVADAVAFEAIDGLPADLADGDADTLATLLCDPGEVPTWSGVAWSCSADADGLADVSCAPGQILVYDGATWGCGDDAVLSDEDVRALIAAEGYARTADLAPVATSGAYADLTGIPAELADGDADTLGLLVCADGEVPVFSGAGWVCGPDATVDEGTVLGWVAGAGYALLSDLTDVALTGSWFDLLDMPPGFADGDDADGLGRLDCPDGQAPIADGGGWVCGAVAGGVELGDLTARLEELETLLSDGDSDGVPDLLDGCPDIPDPDQADGDGDGIGDVCDSCPLGADGLDSDGDTIPDACDICSGADDRVDDDDDGTPDCRQVPSCLEWLDLYPDSPDGIYTLDPDGPGGEPEFETWCDMTTAGGGWTLVMSLVDGPDKRAGDSPDQKWQESGFNRWEDTSTFGDVRTATTTNSGDFKNPAYWSVSGEDLLIYHTPNDSADSDYRASARYAYHTTDGFLADYGGSLYHLYTDYFPLTNTGGPGIGLTVDATWTVGTAEGQHAEQLPNSESETAPGGITFSVNNNEGIPIALCPGVKYLAGNSEHSCVGGNGTTAGYGQGGWGNLREWSYDASWGYSDAMRSSTVMVFVR